MSYSQEDITVMLQFMQEDYSLITPLPLYSFESQLGNLYLGSIILSTIETLKNLKIDYLVNCAKDSNTWIDVVNVYSEYQRDNQHFEFKWIHWEDEMDQRLIDDNDSHKVFETLKKN